MHARQLRKICSKRGKMEVNILKATIYPTKETFVCACTRIEKNLFEARENGGRFCSVLACFLLHTFHVIFCELLKVDGLYPNDLQPVRHKEHLVIF